MTISINFFIGLLIGKLASESYHSFFKANEIDDIKSDFPFILSGGIYLVSPIKNNFYLESGLLYFILLMVISDYHEQAFSTAILPFAFVLNLMSFKIYNLNNLQALQFYIIAIFLIYLVFKNKLGSGDFWIFLLLGFSHSPTFAINSLIFGCIICIFFYIFEDKKSNNSFAFLPYIFAGCLLQNWL